MQNKLLIAVDPGYSGGIAWDDGTVHVQAMPATNGDIAEFFQAFVGKDVIVYLEKTGSWAPPGQGVASLLKFARHCGFLEGVLQSLRLPCVEVSPAIWQKKLGTFSPDKAERKRQIKELVQQRCPAIRVTLSTADALGILLACRGAPL